ncbi:MAG: hypothetical protein ABID04_01265, partial [Patescibacteria group bacterium]
MDLISKLVRPIFAAETPLGTLEGLGPLGLNKNPSDGGNVFVATMSMLIGIFTIIAAIWFLIRVIMAGYNWMNAGGDSNKISDAQSQLTNSLIGLVLVISAIFLLSLVGHLFGGIDFLNLNQMI